MAWFMNIGKSIVIEQSKEYEQFVKELKEAFNIIWDK